MRWSDLLLRLGGSTASRAGGSRARMARRRTGARPNLVPAQVESLESRVLLAADLRPTLVDGPSSAVRGTSVTVTTGVANGGNVASGSYTVRYYASRDATITTADVLLKSVSRTSLSAGASQQWSESVTLPSTLATGAWYLGAIVDPLNSIPENSESNNARADSAAINVTAPQSIDFRPTLVDGPTSGVGGGAVNVVTTVRNQGTNTSGSYSVRYVLSTDATITTADRTLKTVTRSGLAGGAQQQWTESVVLPTDLPTGNYFLGVIVDPLNAYVELSEANNVLADTSSIRLTAPSLIDLDPTTVDGPTSAVRGNAVSVVTRVNNLGSASSGSFTVGYYLSSDANVTTADRLLKTVTRASISGASYQQWTESVTIPADVAAGNWYIGVIVDPSNALRETNETNNAQADTAVIAISAPVVNNSGFAISLTFSGMTNSQINIFNQAAARWSQIITGDLPDVSYNGSVIDDVRISASAAAIDGAGGILGQAGPERLRSGSYLPYLGSMEFDSADLASMESNGTLYAVILHEMGHVLGIGTIWDLKGLLVGAGGATPTFTGQQATAAYNQIFGTSASAVPVEGNNSPVGSRDSHWRESIFRNEIMTPYLSGATNPISRVTVGSLADIGYTVNMNAADAYTNPASIASPSFSDTFGAGGSFSLLQLESRGDAIAGAPGLFPANQLVGPRAGRFVVGNEVGLGDDGSTGSTGSTGAGAGSSNGDVSNESADAVAMSGTSDSGATSDDERSGAGDEQPSVADVFGVAVTSPWLTAALVGAH